MEQDQSRDNIAESQQIFFQRKPRIMCSATSKNCLSRKRNDLTIDRKLKIIEEFTNGVQINSILKKYNINQSHLSSIIRRKAAILQDFHTYGRKQRKRIAKRTKYAPINEEVFRWLLSLNCHVSGSIIQNKAKLFAEQLKIPGFRASNGWLECFRKKYNVSAYKDMNNPYVSSNTLSNSQETENRESPTTQNKQEQLFKSLPNGGVGDMNNRSNENAYSATPVSNDSLASSINPKSPQNYYRRSAQSSNSNKDTNSYSHHYQQSHYQTISPLLNTSNESPILPSSNIHSIGNNYYGVENGNPINRSRNIGSIPVQSNISLTPNYHSSSTENVPMHHLYNKPVHSANSNHVHDIYGYSPSSYQKISQVASSYDGYLSANPTHRTTHSPFQNQNSPTGMMNAPNVFEPNQVFYPADQSHSSKNIFSPAPSIPGKRFINEFNDVKSNVTTGNHIQQQTPIMHPNGQTTNANNNWNDSLATLPTYNMDFVGGNNPSMYYPRIPYSNDNTSSMGYPYNHINRSRPSFHPNQPKDFY